MVKDNILASEAFFISMKAYDNNCGWKCQQAHTYFDINLLANKVLHYPLINIITKVKESQHLTINLSLLVSLNQKLPVFFNNIFCC